MFVIKPVLHSSRPSIYQGQFYLFLSYDTKVLCAGTMSFVGIILMALITEATVRLKQRDGMK